MREEMIPVNNEEINYRLTQLMNRICYADCKKVSPDQCDRPHKCEDYSLLNFLKEKSK